MFAANVSTRMLTLQPSQLTEKEKNSINFAQPHLEIQIKKTQNKKIKNVVCPDHEQRGIPSVSKSEIEIANSNAVTNAESFSEILQLPVHEEMMPTQLSSSPL